MGDMPKILKDIATAARAAPRSAKERNKRVELLGSSGEDEEQEEEEDNAGAASDSSTETADDSDSSGRRARSKQKQRKRAGSAAAAAAAAAGSGRGAKRPRYNHNAPYRRPVSGVPLQQWGYAGQRARNAARAGQMPGGGLFEAPKGQLPMMPTLPRCACLMLVWCCASRAVESVLGAALTLPPRYTLVATKSVGSTMVGVALRDPQPATGTVCLHRLVSSHNWLTVCLCMCLVLCCCAPGLMCATVLPLPPGSRLCLTSRHPSAATWTRSTP